jgi:peptide/nickel transport system substrate-binding protein
MKRQKTAMPAESSSRHLTRRQLVKLAGLTAAMALAPATPRIARGAAPAPKAGGALTLGMANDVLTFDPQHLGLVNYPLIPNLYDSLIRYDHAIKPIPGLAEKWEASPDGKTVTLTLRQGVKFHSGKDLDAAAAIKTFDKARNKATGLNLFEPTRTIESVEAKDRNTLVIRFSQPTPDMFDTMQIMYIIDPDIIPSLKNRGSGTGPFKFVEWVSGDHITLERNPYYWDKEKPLLDRVTFKVYPDTDAMAAALQSGIIDMAVFVPAKDAALLKEKFVLVEGQKGALTSELRINARRPPFEKKEVRQAIQYAIDRKGIVERVMFGVGSPTVVPFPDYSPAYDPKWNDIYKYDLNKAKDLIAKGGYRSGFEAKILIVSTNPLHNALAQVLQADLAKIGCKLTLDPVDSTVYYQKLYAGDFQITPSGSARQHKYPTGLTSNSIYRLANNPGWGDNVPQAYVDAVKDALATMNPARQKDAFRRMTEALMDESWIVNVAWQVNLFALAKHIKGFDYNPDDMPFLHNVSIEK